MRRYSCLVALVALACWLGSSSKNVNAQPCSIEIQNGAFHWMVGISDEVLRSRQRGDRHDYQDLKASIVEKFTKASEWLYRATRRRAYVNEITVVVPDSWDQDSSFQCARQCETYERAKIKIRPPRVDSRGREIHGAFVVPGRCGEEGVMMHLTASRISADSHQASPAEKMIVHEFAHLRYGVGDEYYQSVFGYGADGKPSACSVKVEPLRSRTSGRYAGFDPHNAEGSFMWHQFRSQIMQFCDSSSDSKVQHNRLASNSHNQRCNRRSVWEVLENSPDFCCGRNRPMNFPPESLPRPKFRFVRKCLGGCHVILIDVSASMTGRMMDVAQAAATVIDAENPSGNLALVTFARSTKAVGSLQSATQGYKDYLKRKLPKDDRGIRMELTDIATALQYARNLLGNPSCQQKRITIFSDCGETTSSKVTSSMVLMLQENGIQLNSMTFDDNAPKCMLPTLSRLSEGSTCNQGDMLSSDAALSDCSAPKDTMSCQEHRPHFSMTTAAPSERICHRICLEHDIGRNTRFSVNWNEMMTDAAMAKHTWYLTSPSSSRLRHTVPGYSLDSELMMSSIVVPKAETGIWKLCIRNHLDRAVTFTTNVNTQSKPGRCAICAKGHLSGMTVVHPKPTLLVVEVSKCMMPVLDARVTCHITRPSSPPAMVQLRDDGMGDDDMKNDGIYTATFSRYMGDGQYNVHCTATCQRRAIGEGSDDHDDEIITMVRDSPKRMDDAGEQYDQRMDGMSMDYPDDDRTVASEMDHCCFMRHVSLGAFDVSGFEDGQMQVLERDMVPPAMVNNLKIISNDTSVYPYTATLQFSTTGDDMEFGDAMTYDLRWSNTFEDLDTKFNKSTEPMVLNSPNPLDYPPSKINDMVPQTVQATVTICTPAQPNVVVFFALKAKDETGNVSPLSNVVRLEFEDNNHMARCPTDMMISSRASNCCTKTPSPLDWDEQDPFDQHADDDVYFNVHGDDDGQ